MKFDQNDVHKVLTAFSYKADLVPEAVQLPFFSNNYMLHFLDAFHDILFVLNNTALIHVNPPPEIGCNFISIKSENIFVEGGTDCVTHAFPPIIEFFPITVLPPKIVAPA